MSDVGFSFTKLCAHRLTDQKILFDETLCYHLPAEKKSYTILKHIHDSWFHSWFWNESARGDATASKKFETYSKKKFSQLRVFPVWPNAVIWTQWCPLSSLTLLSFRQLQCLLFPFSFLQLQLIRLRSAGTKDFDGHTNQKCLQDLLTVMINN